MPRALILAVFGVLVLSGASAGDFGTQEPVWTVASVPKEVVPGQAFTIEVAVQVPEGYYQDAASPFLAFEPGPQALVLSRTNSAPSVRAGKASFTGTFTLGRTLTLPRDTAPGPLSLTMTTGWQICRENGVCLLPGEGHLEVKLAVAGNGLAGGLDSGFWLALAGAFLGGLLLNLMPCVFPVLALKAAGLASASARTRAERRRDALGFAAGGLGAITLLGLVTALALALGQRLDWGFSFQQPTFVWALALAFWVLALQLWGLGTWVRSPFSISAPVRPGRAWVGGAFLVVAAAPCTAPLLGPALGFALAQPPALVPLFFMAAGLGLVLPLLVLQVLPGWSRWIPKPGRWMVVAERMAGTFLAATVVYLLGVVVQQTSSSVLVASGVVLTLVAGAGLLASRKPMAKTAVNLVLVLVVGGSFFLVSAPGPATSVPVEGWTPFSESALAGARALGRPVLVDATAAWCATCQVNEWAVLDRPDVRKTMDALGFVLVRADYTRPDPAVKAWLASVGRAGLPVYALYVPGKPVYLFPELLTDGNFTDALGHIVGGTDPGPR